MAVSNFYKKCLDNGICILSSRSYEVGVKRCCIFLYLQTLYEPKNARRFLFNSQLLILNLIW